MVVEIVEIVEIVESVVENDCHTGRALRTDRA